MLLLLSQRLGEGFAATSVTLSFLMPLPEILSLYYLLTLYLLLFLHIPFSFRTCGFPKPCPRAEFSWLENALILFRVLPNPGLLKRGIEMLYSTTHGRIPSVYQTAYCTQNHHEFSRAPYASERGNCKCMNQGIERNIKQADRELKHKETERIRACLRSWFQCGGIAGGRERKKEKNSSSIQVHFHSLLCLSLVGLRQIVAVSTGKFEKDCW